MKKILLCFSWISVFRMKLYDHTVNDLKSGELLIHSQ